MKNKLLTNGAQSFAFAAPDAMSVQLVGDFTHWLQSPIQLRKDPRGIWRTQVDLAPGTYHYKFLVEGQWHDDPECVLRVANSYGGENIMRKVKGQAQNEQP